MTPAEAIATLEAIAAVASLDAHETQFRYRGADVMLVVGDVLIDRAPTGDYCAVSRKSGRLGFGSLGDVVEYVADELAQEDQ